MTVPKDMLPVDDHPDATAEGQLGTVSDGEYFAALDRPVAPDRVFLVNHNGETVDHTGGIRDERGL